MAVILVMFGIVIVRGLGARFMMIMVFIVRVGVMFVFTDLALAVVRMNRTAPLRRMAVLREVHDRVADVNVIRVMEDMVKRRRDDGAVTVDKDRPCLRRKRVETPPHAASEYEFRAEPDGSFVGTPSRMTLPRTRVMASVAGPYGGIRCPGSRFHLGLHWLALCPGRRDASLLKREQLAGAPERGEPENGALCCSSWRRTARIMASSPVARWNRVVVWLHEMDSLKETAA